MSEEQPSASLLFVDDEASILSSLRRLFRPQGYRIHVAESGAQGLEVLEREPIDLVISDMRMPQMDGAQFLEKVRERWPQAIRILLTGYADVTSTIAAINRGEIYRYISKPWDDNDIVLIVRQALERRRLEQENERLLGLTQRQNDELKELNASLEQKVEERTAELREALASLERALGQLRLGFLATVKVFSGLIELRGGRFAGHSRRVADYARQLARKLEMDELDQHDVMLAALLHDIGKISLPDGVLDRPFNALTGPAKAEFMLHPIKGQQVLMGVEQFVNAGKIIRHHHECMDGSGYPDGLAGLAIPLGARVIAVANDYDALQMGALTLLPLSPADAMDFLVKNRGVRYDPSVVDAFKAMIAEKAARTFKEAALRPAQLKPGMVLARDLAHRDGYLLLSQGHVLDSEMIARLAKLETAEGYVVTAHVQQYESPAVLKPPAPERPARGWKEIPMPTARLKPGMMLTRKLLHQDGYLLLSSGHYLDEALIKQLKKLEAADGRPLTLYIRMEDKP